MPDAALPAAIDRFPPPDKQCLLADQRAAYDFIEGRRGRIPAPHQALLGSPEVAEAFERLSAALQSGALAPAVREAVFLMAARRHGCAYLWINHLDKAREAGLDDAALAALGRGKLPAGPPEVAAAARFHQALRDGHRVPQPVYDEALAALGPRGVIDLAAFCGFAASVALLLNVRQPALPAGPAAPF